MAGDQDKFDAPLLGLRVIARSADDDGTAEIVEIAHRDELLDRSDPVKSDTGKNLFRFV